MGSRFPVGGPNPLLGFIDLSVYLFACGFLSFFLSFFPFFVFAGRRGKICMPIVIIVIVAVVFLPRFWQHPVSPPRLSRKLQEFP